MIQAVLDTNVIVSGLASENRSAVSPPGAVLRAWIERRFVLVTSVPIIEEIHQVLATDYFRQRISDERLARLFAAIDRYASIVDVTSPEAGLAPHRHDDPILSTGIIAGAEAIVTGDRELLAMRQVKGIELIGPREFLLRLS